jgi:DNA repair exonuclease SbcCD nuclease subunit
LFVGDLYKTAIGKPTQTEQWAAAEFFHALAGIAPVIAKVGNHDEGEFSGEGFGVHALEIFGAMNIRMTVLPKPTEWSVITLAGVKVGLYHGMLSNTRLESGMVSDSVRSGLPSIHDAPPADLWLLGDIHKRQFLKTNAAYCGAPDRLNFGEEDELPTIWDITVTKDTNGTNVEWNAIPTPARKFVTISDEADVDDVEVKDSTVRFVGELKKYTQGELIQHLKKRGALEVTSVADTSEFDEAPTIYTSFVPSEAFTIWLEAQPDVTKDLKAYSQELLKELTS